MIWNNILSSANRRTVNSTISDRSLIKTTTTNGPVTESLGIQNVKSVFSNEDRGENVYVIPT